MEPNASFRKRLAVLQGKELMQATQLSDLDPRTVIRRCVKVGQPHSAHSGHRDRAHDGRHFKVHCMQEQVQLLQLRGTVPQLRRICSNTGKAGHHSSLHHGERLRASLLSTGRCTSGSRHCDGLYQKVRRIQDYQRDAQIQIFRAQTSLLLLQQDT